MSDILAADYYVNNARLFEAAAKLWVKPDDVVLDPTYGKGGFYKRFRPANLLAFDLDVEKSPGGVSVDFREMPITDASVDVVVFDPAYVTPGGRATSTIPAMNEAYGMDTAEPTVAQQWRVIHDGMHECHRVLKPGGIFMQKCMAFISSGHYQNVPFDVTLAMGEIGFGVVDQFLLVKKSGGPQPKNRTRKCKACKGTGSVDGEQLGVGTQRAMCEACHSTGRIATVQQHARNNVSFLIVARKPK